MPDPRTPLPDSRVSPRFAGLVTFARYPRLTDLTHAPSSSPLDWRIYGVPFDAGVTYRPGARFAPRAIRDASQYLKRYHVEHAVDICNTLAMADAGDAPVRPYSCRENTAAVAAWAAALPGGPPTNPPTRLLALGGDHSIALANLRATHTRLGAPKPGLPLIHFDAHLDTVDAVWGEQYSHASPFIRAIEEGLIDPTRMVSLGIRGPLNTAADLDFARDHNATIITYEDWRYRNGQQTLAAALAKIADTPAYLTFDIDALDPAYAPATGTPCPGGFTTAEALHALRSLRGLNIAGADVVEVLPDRDPAGTTAFLAAHIAFEILALDAARRTA
ncbi:MAG: agmatinase [Phycisphaerales bacterium]